MQRLCRLIDLTAINPTKLGFSLERYLTGLTEGLALRCCLSRRAKPGDGSLQKADRSRASNRPRRLHERHSRRLASVDSFQGVRLAATCTRNGWRIPMLVDHLLLSIRSTNMRAAANPERERGNESGQDRNQCRSTLRW
jgi:hypothetical protein